MALKKFNLIIVCTIYFVFSYSTLLSQTITSTSAGGPWSSTATWAGGVIPGAGNDVVIAGNVIYKNGDGSCRNLTVNSGDTLYNQTGYAWGEQILTVTGNVTNNGTIMSQSNLFVLKISGNIINNGKWIFKRTELAGSGTQIISSSNSSKFENYFLVDANIKPTVAAGSKLIFTSSFDLSKSTFNANNFDITLLGEAANITNGNVNNTGIIKGSPIVINTSSYYPIINNITYSGNINTRGILRINSDVIFSGSIIITDTLENSAGYAHPEKILQINGSFTNNGLVRNGGSSGLAIKVTGNCINNGKLEHNRMIFNGSGIQTLSANSTSKYGKILVDGTSKPSIAAGSKLIFTSTFDLSTSSFNANNFDITLLGDAANITNGTVTNTAVLRGSPIDVTINYYPIINNITYNGNINTKGILRINSNVVFNGTVVNTDTLENSAGYGHPEKVLQINGNFTNYGLIRNGGSSGFAINLTGDFVNNGNLTHNRTIFSASGTQTISTTNGSNFDKLFLVDATAKPKITMGSNLVFSSSFDLSTSTLNANNFDITLLGEGANITNGKVTNAGVLKGSPIYSNNNAYYPIINNITYDGKIITKGILRINFSVVFSGSVVNTDTLQNSTGYAHPEKMLQINGSFTNNGLARNGGSSGFAINITGNFNNNGSLLQNRTIISGSGRRTIYAVDIPGPVQANGTNIILTGQNTIPHLSVIDGSYCEVAGDGVLYVIDGTVTGKLINKGEVISSQKISSAGERNFPASNARFSSITGLDSLTVRHFGYTVLPSFSNSLKAYWRFNPVPGNSTITLDYVTFYYENDQLGSNDESSLQLFHSVDGAQTWKQISTPQSITRDTDNNFVRVNNIPLSGDFVLSSSGNPLTVIPSIAVSIIGRSQIRVGPPNRYTIYYVNNSDVPTDDFLLAINTGTNVHILKTEHTLADGSVEVVPYDSLFYENEDTTLVMYVAGLAPREERTFDIIATADNVGLNKTNKTDFIDPASITVATVAVWAAKSAAVYVTVKTIDYFGSKAVEATNLTPDEKRKWEERYTKIPDEIKTKDSKKVWAAKSIGTKIIEKSMGIIGGGVDVARAVGRNIWNLGPNLRRRFFAKWSNNSVELADEIMEDGRSVSPEISGSNIKTTKRVTSWDPNEKIGPTGFGVKKFITTAGKMTYQILFENKKEATAPAYKIVIIDTLQSVFDPTTVEFGKKSHEGELYNWIITREDNILKWEIEGIELPPNQTPPEGEGYVSFTVSTKDNLASGTEIPNRATITFDINKPINTNEYINKLDFTPPATVMKSIGSMNNEDKLVVKWESNDGNDGSGVESSSIFVSVDDGPFDLAGISGSDSLLVKAVSGTHTYSFYALAKDSVGNVEAIRPEIVTTTATTSVEKKDDSLPEEFSLEQNYPNPFNPNTIIEFSIPNKANVLLEVFNILGERIELLIDRELDASFYKVNFNAKGLSSGVYFYRIIADGFVQTKKMLFLK